MKLFMPLVLLLLFTSATAQTKYAVLLSSLPQAAGEERIIARNNFNHMQRALDVQGFHSRNIFFDTTSLDRAKLFSFMERLTMTMKKGDFVLVYSDLPAFSQAYADSTWERMLRLSNNGQSVSFPELGKLFQNVAVKAGDDQSMFFTILDCKMSPSLHLARRGDDSYSWMEHLNVLTATKDAEQPRLIENNTSVFTRAVAQTLMNGSIFNQSYQTFGNAVRKELFLHTTRQEPMITGDRSRVLFRGLFRQFPAHFNVISVAGNIVSINAGSGLGYETGAKVTFYKAFTNPTPDNLLGQGKIVSVSATRSRVELQQEVQLSTDAWAFIEPGEKLVKLQWNTSYAANDPKLVQQLLSQVNAWDKSSLYLENVTKGGDLAIGNVTRVGKDSVQYTIIHPVNGYLFEKITLPVKPGYIGPVKELVQRHARFKEIYGLRNFVPELNIEAEIIPLSKNAEYENGFPIFHEGDRFSIRLINNGTVTVYFNVLDMLGDRSIKVLVPYDGSTGEDFRIEPGGEMAFDVETDEYSFGWERLKIFSSLRPFDLRSVVNRSLTRSAPDAVSSILDNSNGSNRSARLDYEQIHIFNLDMEVRSAGYAKDQSKKKLPRIRFETITASQAKLRLNNTTQETLYFNILSEQQDGSYVVAYPSADANPYDCFVKPGAAGDFILPAMMSEDEQVIAVYADRPVNLNDHVNAERDLNQLLLEIMREGRISGTAYNKVGVVHQLYRSETLAATRTANTVSIKLLTPKIPAERSVSIKARTRMFDLAGMAYTEGYQPVKGIRINGDAVNYDPDLKLFEKSIELQSGVNKVIIEAMDEKGITVARSIEVELEGATAIVKGEGKNYFLGIGINKYKMLDELYNAESDVLRFADLLKASYGFAPENVTMLLDTAANRKNIINKIRYYLAKAGPNDNVIIYLSGHGNEDQLADGDYYFYPQESDPSDVTTAVKSSDIVDNFKRIRAKHCVLIVDACYAGMITNSVYGVGTTVAAQKKPEEELPSKWIITSGRATKVLDGEPGKNSPFAASLINYLRDNNDPGQLKISRLISHLEEVVPKISNQKPLGKQIDGEGEMIFRRK